MYATKFIAGSWKIGLLILCLVAVACRTAVELSPVYVKWRKVSCTTIPRGNYRIGCDDSEVCPNNPSQEVAVEDFCIDKLPVSSEELNSCVHEKVCSSPVEHSPMVNQVGQTEPQFAAQYCALKGGALPSAIQAEVAVRNNSTLPYPWGVGARVLRDQFSTKTKTNTLRHQKPDEIAWTDIEDLVNGTPELVVTPQGYAYRGEFHALQGQWAGWFRTPVSDLQAQFAFRCVYPPE